MQNLKNQILILLPVLIVSNGLGLFSIMDSLKVVMIAGLLFWGMLQYRRTVFDKAFLTMLVGIFLSSVSCFLFRDQSYVHSVIALFNFLSIGFYYYYLRQEFDTEDLWDALVLLGKIVLVVYLLKYVLLQFGISLTRGEADAISNTEMVRMRINCSAALFFLYFHSLQEFLDKYKVLAILWIVAVLFVAILMNFRSILAGLALCTLFQIWQQRVELKMMIFASLLALSLGGVALQSDLVNAKIDNIVYRQQTQTLANANDARVRQWDYYTNRHFLNPVEQLLGSGYPSNKSEYGKYMKSLNDQQIYFNDWGLIGLTWVVGIVTLLGILWYVWIAASSGIDDPCLVTWFVFLVIVSIFNYELPRTGNFAVQAIAMAYIIKRKEDLKNEAQEKEDEGGGYKS